MVQFSSFPIVLAPSNKQMVRADTPSYRSLDRILIRGREPRRPVLPQACAMTTTIAELSGALQLSVRLGSLQHGGGALHRLCSYQL